MSLILKTIDIPLSKSGINQAIKEIYRFRDALIETLNALIKALAESGAEIARVQVAAMDAVDTGQLEHSIQGSFNPETRTGVIVADCPYAIYVEYGTGPVGEESPHPEPDTSGWAYNVGETIHQNIQHPEWGVGWWYPGDDGKYHWTNGQPARPFMYNTLAWLEEEAESMASTMWNQM